MAQVLGAFAFIPWSSTWRTLLDSTAPLSTSSSSSCLSPSFLFHLELFLELHYTKVMANLRLSTATESEDTLNVFHCSTTPRSSNFAKILPNSNVLRQTIIAEYREKVSHHELQAAHAEEERRLLQVQLWRQKLKFREAHQQSLTEMEVLRKFQSSTFDTIARRKLIEDQNNILELSGRVQ